MLLTHLDRCSRSAAILRWGLQGLDEGNELVDHRGVGQGGGVAQGFSFVARDLPEHPPHDLACEHEDGGGGGRVQSGELPLHLRFCMFLNCSFLFAVVACQFRMARIIVVDRCWELPDRVLGRAGHTTI